MTQVVLSYGLGTDSTAILLRWIYEPETRPCDLSELLVITAMTGDEWPESGRLVSEYILPLLRANRIRYVQVARHGPLKADGITVLDDSSLPYRLFIEGDYKLSQEMTAAGTVPQVGGIRKCSLKAKGEVIDRYLAKELGGRPFLHVVGFELFEQGRAQRDAKYNTEQRTGSYPLIEWGWDRAACERYIKAKTGADWIKSACVYCPFALANKAGRERVDGMFTCDPVPGVAALIMEHLSVSLNPKQGLMANDRLVELLARSGRHQDVLDEFMLRLNRMEWAVYEVRRVSRPQSADPSKPQWYRKVQAIASGTKSEMIGELRELAVSYGTEVDRGDTIARVYLHRRAGDSVRDLERFYVAAPVGAVDKETNGFGTAWSEYFSLAA